MQPLAPYVKRSGDTMTGELTVDQQIANNAGGYKFPDGSVQITAGQGVEYSAESDAVLVAGQPVYLKASGHLGLAQANAVATSSVSGLASAACAIGFAGTYLSDNKLTLVDWTPVTGSEHLTVGSPYFLDPDTAGRLTTIAPTSIGEVVIKVGVATSEDTLDIEIGTKILL